MTAGVNIPVQAAISGMQASLVHTSNGDPVRMMVSVGQVLYWACALAEQLDEIPDYRGRRAGDFGTRIIPALKIARNAISHGLLVVAHPHEATDDEVPIVWRQARWAALGTFIGQMGRTPSARDQQTWTDEIAGQNVSATLLHVTQSLIFAAHRHMPTTTQPEPQG